MNRTLAAAAALVLLTAACGAVDPSEAPGTPSPIPTSAATPATASPSAGEPGQTETEWEWGRIWDDIPATFPRVAGSIPTEMGEGPASATLAVPTDVQAAADFMQAALETAAYSTEAKSGPLEDGSFVIDSIGEDPACRVETRLTPLSGTTVMTVMFGAGCPFE